MHKPAVALSWPLRGPLLLMLALSLCPHHLTEAALEHGTWDYGARGPEAWPGLFKQFCSGRKQSPIDLGLTTSVLDPQLSEYTMRVEESTQYNLILENDGHKLQLSIGDNLVIRMGLGDTMYYTAAQLHWHWGSVDSRGSEHTIAGSAFPMEGHLVFYNSYDYPNASVAMHSVGGLAVLGVFYEVSKDDNPLIAAIEKHLPQLINAQSKVVANFSVDKLDFLNAFLPTSIRHFYRYEGSLTTPTCNENVLWTVYTTAVPISQRQLKKLRELRYADGKPCVDNYRPVQPLNPTGRPGAKRVVYRTFDSKGRALGDRNYDTRGTAGGSVAAPGLAAVAAAATITCLTMWTTAAY